jgi:DNA-binding transcriptional regulator LsrR (DeoR family)
MFVEEDVPPEIHSADRDLAARAVWLAYIAGCTQDQIGARLGLSRIKVNRLLAFAHKRGLVKVSIEAAPSECLALEERLVQSFGLRACGVVPNVAAKGERDSAVVFDAIGLAAAQFLQRFLDNANPKVIGIGWGRTLAAMVDRMPLSSHPNLKVVALLGSLTRRSSANPYEVAFRLAQRTGAEGYFLPVPFVADTAADKQLLMAQKSVQDIHVLTRKAELHLVGIGELEGTPIVRQLALVSEPELAQLRRAGAVGNVLANFIDAEGRLVDCDLNRRSLGCSLEELRGGRFVVGVAGGMEKVEAIRAALNSGVLSGLITDEGVARALVGRLAEHGAPGVARSAKTRGSNGHARPPEAGLPRAASGDFR